MSAERERLAELLEEEQESGRWASSPTADLYGFMADAILAAGYRKPRTITTADEADELPAGTIVLGSDGDVARKFPGGWRTLVTESDGTAWLSGHMEDPDYPATVLYAPEES